jgi:hypothetical protein
MILRNTIASYGVFLSITLNAQTDQIEVTDQIHPEVHFTTIIALDSLIAVTSWSDPGNVPVMPKRLLFYSLSGELISSQNLDLANAIRHQNPSRSTDGGFWIGGGLDACDVLVGGRIMRFDRNGDISLDRTYTPEELEDNIVRINAIAKNTTKYLAYAGNGVAIADTLGDIIDHWDIDGISFERNFQWYNDSTLLNYSLSSIELISIGGTILQSRSFGQFVNDILVSDDHIWALGDNMLFQLGPDLATIDSFPYPTQPAPRHFVEGGTTNYVQLNNALYQIDPTEGLVPYLSPAMLEGQNVMAYTVKDSVVLAIGDQSIEPYSTGFLKSYDLNGQGSDHDIDLSIEGVTVDSMWMDYYEQAQWANQYGNLTVMVTNSGSEPTNAFMLAYRQGLFPITCGRSTTYLEIQNANLLPGSSSLYTMYDVTLWRGQLEPEEVIDHEVCVSVLPQDGWMDRAVTNNTICTPIEIRYDIQVNVPSIVRSPKVASSIISDRLNVVLPDQERTFIGIYSATGELVHEQLLEGAGQHLISTTTWNSGCYVIAFRSGTKVIHQRIIKE